jgi:transcription elongation GreA/GreB family factor
MTKEEIKQKLMELHAQLDQVIADIQTERQDAKEDESSVIEELMINQGILEEQVTNLESLLFDTKKYSKRKYVLHQNGTKKKVSIVHEQMADSSKGLISASCPLAKALEKAKVGEKIKITTPMGEAEYMLLGIE